MPELLLLNGPNLGRLGTRLPSIYGTKTLEDITKEVDDVLTARGWNMIARQSNHEGDLIDVLDSHADVAGAVVNPGALMMNGWSLRDALESFAPPWIEVHISNIFARESFRHQSILAGLASGVVAGLGAAGYRLAAMELMDQYERQGHAG